MMAYSENMSTGNKKAPKGACFALPLYANNNNNVFGLMLEWSHLWKSTCSAFPCSTLHRMWADTLILAQ